MKKILAVLLMMFVLLSSCGEKQTASSAVPSDTSSGISSETSSGIHSEISSEPESEPSSDIPSEPADDVIYSADLCFEHDPAYHSFSPELVGKDAFMEWYGQYSGRDEWNREAENATITDYVEYFGISREELAGAGIQLSEQQLDALYSGDQTLVNEAFCGELAFVHMGEIISPYWLAEHTARDLFYSGISGDVLRPMLDCLETDYAPFSAAMKKLALDARVTLESSVALGNYYPCYAHTGNYHHHSDGLYELIGGFDAAEKWFAEQDALYYGDEPFSETDYLSLMIREFGIEREALAALTNPYTGDPEFTDEQIDALYSGDPAKVNEAFCGQMAFVHEGELWSIYRLAQMDDLSGLPREKIETILKRTEGHPDNFLAMAEKIRFTLRTKEIPAE